MLDKQPIQGQKNTNMLLKGTYILHNTTNVMKKTAVFGSFTQSDLCWVLLFQYWKVFNWMVNDFI